MSRIRFVLTYILFLFFCNQGITQCNIPNPSPGLFCDPSVPDGAPLLCNLDCLDGYTARMPEVDTSVLAFQPRVLCDAGQLQGEPNNLSWFAFVAGSTTIELRITPSNCTIEENNQIGVQAGIYTKCYTWEKLYCMSECTDEAFDIGGPGFVPGEIYYFFIDGCVGSVCDYEVEVLRGDQPFALPDIDSIIFDTGSTTFCRGENVQAQLTGLVQDSIEYMYTIDPPTSLYPTGIHPESSLSVTTWTLNEAGVFQICAEATNGCDVTPTYCQTIEVISILDEVFTPVDICLDDLPNYEGPDIENPNGDTIVGWQSDMLLRPGLNRDTIYLSNGCFYTQELTINTISLPAREEVELVLCYDDFPYDYEGVVIDSSLVSFPLSLDGRASSGCDSLVSLTTRVIDIEGDFQITGCSGGEGILSFVITNNTVSNSGTVMTTWTDQAGSIIPSINGDPFSINVNSSGTFTINISMEDEGVTCQKSVTSVNIDILNLAPSPPIPSNWDLTFCPGGSSQTLRVEDIGDGAIYTWVVPGDVMGSASAGDSLVVDWGTSAGGNVCVTVTNSCGTSQPYCEEILVDFGPDIEIITDTVVCTDTVFDIMFNGPQGLIYDWSLVLGQVVNTTNEMGPGPHTVSVLNTDQRLHDLILNIQSNGCAFEYREVIRSVPVIPEPRISCRVTDNSILFSWEENSNANSYDVVLIDGSGGELAAGSYNFTGLNRDDQVTISVQGIGELDCATTAIVSQTCVASCDAFTFGISASDNSICEGDPAGAVSLSIEGDTTQGVFDLIGDGMVDGIFRNENLGVGTYSINASLEIDGCFYQDSVAIEIRPIPQFSIEIEQPICPDDMQGRLTIAPAPSSSLMYSLDGMSVIDSNLDIAIGSYILTADDGCINTESITILEPSVPNINLGNLIGISEGVDYTIVPEYDGIDTSLITNLQWYNDAGDIICNGSFLECGQLDFTPQADGELCVDINYGDNCMVTQCALLDVVRIVNIHAANIFSPNGDGINDRFFITSNQPDIMISKFRLFDRWGSIMHTLDNVPIEGEGVSWDGTYRGKIAEEGVYGYFIEFMEEGRKILRKGTVTLIK